MNKTRIFLKTKEDENIRAGFPWVFDNEIAFVKTQDEKGAPIQTDFSQCIVPDGTLADVVSKGGMFLGCGILNKKSKIALRILSKNQQSIEDFNLDFFTRLIQNAYELRSFYFSESDSYRLLFAEADLLPGVIVDRFCDVSGKIFLSIQFLTLGAEIFRKHILDALRSVCKPTGIFERSDVSVRELEGLPEEKGWIGTAFNPQITIIENGVKITVDLENGQKTGYFLDQKYNRLSLIQFSKNKRVLDTFSHTGAFSLCAAKAGAKEVIAVDISETAVQIIQKNAQQNGFEKHIKTICADTFDYLRTAEQNKEQFDVIVLDPPAFTKSAKMNEKAYGGYKEINMRAMKLLKSGGILITCSCSHFFDTNTFYAMLAHAAFDTHKTVQILQKSGATPDHPVLIGYPKSDYLKCAVLRVL